MDAYRDVIDTIVTEWQRFTDRPVDEPELAIRRLADRYAEAASLAPDDVADAWRTIAAMLHRTVRNSESKEPDVPARAVTEAEGAAFERIEEHLRAAFGVELNPPRPPRDEGPPPEIPAEPVVVVPDGPVDEEEYSRRRAAIDDDFDEDLLRVPSDLMAHMVESTERIVEVAPLDLRPAWSVLAAAYRDLAAHGGAPGPIPGLSTVSKEQFLAATRILAHAERTARQERRPETNEHP